MSKMSTKNPSLGIFSKENYIILACIWRKNDDAVDNKKLATSDLHRHENFTKIRN